MYRFSIITIKTSLKCINIIKYLFNQKLLFLKKNE